MATIERSHIDVVLRGVDKTGNVRESMKRIVSQTQRVEDGFNKLTKVQKKVGDAYQTIETRTQRVTGQQKKFQFELLGTLFFGMAIQKFFGKWVTGADQMLGITELVNQALSLSVLRFIMPYTDAIYGAIKAYFGWSEGTQAMVGGLISLGYVVGTVMGTVSQFALGWASLLILAEKYPIITTALNAITTGVPALLLLAGAIWVVYEAWKALKQLTSEEGRQSMRAGREGIEGGGLWDELKAEWDDSGILGKIGVGLTAAWIAAALPAYYLAGGAMDVGAVAMGGKPTFFGEGGAINTNTQSSVTNINLPGITNAPDVHDQYYMSTLLNPSAQQGAALNKSF